MDSELEPGPELLQPSHPLCSANKQIQPRPEFHLDPSIDKNMESRSLKPFGWMTAALQHRSLAEPVSAATMLPPAALSTQQPAHHSLLPDMQTWYSHNLQWTGRPPDKGPDCVDIMERVQSIYTVSTEYLHSIYTVSGYIFACSHHEPSPSSPALVLGTKVGTTECVCCAGLGCCVSPPLSHI